MRDPPQILIVDDNAANVDILETLLAAHGYDIITASDGAEGLAVTKPVDQKALVARVKSMLRIKELHDTSGVLTIRSPGAVQPMNSRTLASSARGLTGFEK